MYKYEKTLFFFACQSEVLEADGRAEMKNKMAHTIHEKKHYISGFMWILFCICVWVWYENFKENSGEHLSHVQKTV